MKTHQAIDQRSLALARDIVRKIDRDPEHQGLNHARALCDKWFQTAPLPAHAEWRSVLSRDWESVRAVLLDESDYGKRMRQNSPFCGVLTSEERRRIFRKFSHG